MKNIKKISDEQLLNELTIANAKMQILLTEKMRRIDEAMAKKYEANIRLKKTK